MLPWRLLGSTVLIASLAAQLTSPQTEKKLVKGDVSVDCLLVPAVAVAEDSADILLEVYLRNNSDRDVTLTYNFSPFDGLWFEVEDQQGKSVARTLEMGAYISELVGDKKELVLKPNQELSASACLAMLPERLPPGFYKVHTQIPGRPKERNITSNPITIRIGKTLAHRLPLYK